MAALSIISHSPQGVPGAKGTWDLLRTQSRRTPHPLLGCPRWLGLAAPLGLQPFSSISPAMLRLSSAYRPGALEGVWGQLLREAPVDSPAGRGLALDGERGRGCRPGASEDPDSPWAHSGPPGPWGSQPGTPQVTLSSMSRPWAHVHLNFSFSACARDEGPFEVANETWGPGS